MNCHGLFRTSVATLMLGSAALGASAGGAAAATTSSQAPLQASCQLNSAGGQIKRVINIVFDNVHLRRDNPNVPSDLEQMPNLLNFIQNNGTMSGTHYTPLISHTADDIITALTGVYGERHGQPVSNSYGYFKSNGSVGFSSSFLYWTAIAGDGKPQMVNEKGKMTPAPWVAYTRAGCDVGAFSVANIEFESVPADVGTVFGTGSTQYATVQSELASSNAQIKAKPKADYLGIAIHCAQNSPLCTGANASNAAPDLLPDEPGGYAGFSALYGNINVQPAISAGPVTDLDGNQIADAYGNPGFPNSFSPTATQSLGYAATMIEAGVPVVYIYIADAHDSQTGSGAFGPGQAGYVQQLASYNVAFGKFFQRLAADGITPANTLFVVHADENDHFAGGAPSPANCDGVTTPCTYAQIGEVDTYLDRLLATQRSNTTSFQLHFDSAPNFYIVNNPAQTDPVTRQLEKDVNALQVTNPISGVTQPINQYLADRAEMQLLHMVTSSPARTPSFTMFGNPDYYNQTAGNHNACVPQSACVYEAPAFAWNHGDVQQEITETWLGLVGPGVLVQGRNDSVFSDHTDVRPTVMALVGLADDYSHDGRVLVEKLSPSALPPSLAASAQQYASLAALYKEINAPLGPVGRHSLVYSNGAIVADDTTYANYLTSIGMFTASRNAVASQMIAALEAAAFGNAPLQPSTAVPLIATGRNVLVQGMTLH